MSGQLLSYGRDRQPVQRLTLLLAALLWIAATPSPAAAAELDQSAPLPSVFLPQANTPRAKALALDAALSKGWQVAGGGPDFSVFETLISEPHENDWGEQQSVRVRLRIRADFRRQGSGTEVVLRATEIRAPGSAAERHRDVTGQYSANLNNALQSLRYQWEDFALQGHSHSARTAGSATSSAPGRSARPASRQEISAPRAPVGQWAYEAEELARQRGCLLTERGATLTGDEGRDERHRVDCRNRPPLTIDCNAEGCRTAR